MPKPTLPNLNPVSTPAPLSWQERDALTVMKSLAPNMRPDDKIDFKRLWHGAANAQFTWSNVEEGIRGLVARGDFQLADGETNLMLMQQGFDAHW